MANPYAHGGGAAADGAWGPGVAERDDRRRSRARKYKRMLTDCFMSASGAYSNIEAELRKIGQIVDPACTAKLYRPMMPPNDFNTYWPPDAPQPKTTAPIYPGVTIVRDQSFGTNPKDVLDILVGEKGGDKRPVVMYVPGGAGNKLEQQVREGNAFYDNIGRWATKNGMVGVLVQRHPGQNWDDGGRDLSMAVDWVHDNISKYKGDPNHIVIWAHSAGNGPLGVPTSAGRSLEERRAGEGRDLHVRQSR